MSTALLLIDIQNDYFPGGRMELVNSPEAAGAAARLLSAFRRTHRPVYHVRHVSRQPAATFFLPDSAGACIHDTLSPVSGEAVITKHYPNSFRETSLLERFRADGIDHLLIGGMMTHMCVDATVRAAYDLGFNCTVAHDACATRDLLFGNLRIPADHVHGSFLAALGSVYAQLKGTDEILDNIGTLP